MNTSETVAFTSHRDLRAWNVPWIVDAFEFVALSLHAFSGMKRFTCGMARGGDLLWGSTCQKFSLPVEAHVPFKDWRKKWDRIDYNLAEIILARSVEMFDYDELIPGRSINQHYWDRNAGMLARARLLVALWDGRDTGGTFGTVKLAQAMNMDIIFINPATEKIGWLEYERRT